MRDGSLKTTLCAGLGAVGLLMTGTVAGTGGNEPDFALLERGHYLTVAADCAPRSR